MDASITLTGGPRCKMDLLKKTLKETDIFIPSYEEAAYLAQRSDIYGIIEEFRKFPLRILYPGIRVTDTTGAGDCFIFKAGILRKPGALPARYPPIESLRRAPAPACRIFRWFWIM